MKDIYTVLVGGKAGEGVKKLAQLLAKTALDNSLHCFQSDDYQSLIKGGHNFSTVSISDQPIHNSYKSADLIICLDQHSFTKHISELKPGGAIFYNSDEASNEAGFGLPLTTLMKESYQHPSNLSIAGLAIFYAYMGLSQDEMHKLIRSSYKKQIEENLIFADKCFPLVEQTKNLPCPTISNTENKLYTGNQAISLGAWLAGLDMYFAYPMTPASSILHYLATMSSKLGVKAIHAESELAAANMAVGAVVGGARAAIGSSGGGFALMQEAFSMAGITEAPLLCVLSSRPGPATGVSTYTAQEDLYFALHQGHGEFDRIVASPDCMERAFSLAGELLSLAWELQIPTILLTEKHLSESMQDVKLHTDHVPEANHLKPTSSEDYKRYQLTDNGISPLLFPPSEQVIKWNSHEHLESGLRTDMAEAMVAMKDKRGRKPINEACSGYQRHAIYGNGSKYIFAYGSTALEVREAMEYLDSDYTLVVPIYLEPLAIEELLPYCSEPAIVIEHNSRPRFAQFLKEKLGLTSKADILRYDGRAWDPIELAEKIKEVDNA